MEDLREIAAYLKGAHHYESAGAVLNAAEWREDVEMFLGQYGVESISVMLEIIEAARMWRGLRNGTMILNRTETYHKLENSVDAYDEMVARRVGANKNALD